MLPFGLRSAPKIFNALADAVEWCVSKEGVPYVYHYLDDFVVLGPPQSDACLNFLLKLKRVCEDLGIPLAPEKEDGPKTIITILGIEIDTVKGELRLRKEKMQRLSQTLAEWEERKACTPTTCNQGYPTRKILLAASHFIAKCSKTPTSSYPSQCRIPGRLSLVENICSTLEWSIASYQPQQ